MPKYYAYASYTTFVRLEIEADNREDAERIAEETDGSDFKEYDHSRNTNWQIDHVALVSKS